MIRSGIIALLFLLAGGGTIYAQEINFGEYGNYSLTVGELNNDDLGFGQVISGSGSTSSIGINNAKIIEITGVKYLDVIVDVQASQYLYLNGVMTTDDQKRIPLTLEAAYANNAGQPNVGQAKFINIASNSFIKQFPILERQSQPPGPPPPPPTNQFEQDQVEETAYFYLYGSITVGDVDAGSYSTEITVTISYD